MDPYIHTSLNYEETISFLNGNILDCFCLKVSKTFKYLEILRVVLLDIETKSIYSLVDTQNLGDSLLCCFILKKNKTTFKTHSSTRISKYKDSYTKKGELLGLSSIELDLSGFCNRKCSFCPRSFKVNPFPNVKEYMSLDTLKVLIIDLLKSNYKGSFHLVGYGEPFCNPNLLDMVSLLRNSFKNSHIEITTNGDFFDTSILNSLVKRGLNLLRVNCYDDGFSLLKTHLLLSKIDGLSFSLFPKYFNPNENIEDVFSRFGFNNRCGLFKSTKAQALSKKVCYYPFYRAYVYRDGSCILCCNDWKLLSKGLLGNIHEIPFSKIWMSKPLNDLRKSLMCEGRKRLPCVDCDVQGNLFGLESFDIFRAYFESL